MLFTHQVYCNQDSVDDALVELLYRPSCDEGAIGVFVSVLTGPPGPRPWDVTTRVAPEIPMLVLWGEEECRETVVMSLQLYAITHLGLAGLECRRSRSVHSRRWPHSKLHCLTLIG